mgnify:CR=1 FL=1
MKRTLSLLPSTKRTPPIKDESTTSPIFGLRYLEEEATDIYDVVGCMRIVEPIDDTGSSWNSGCDVDYD